jgi:tetratricopeptide (TPR) repeat protein
MRPTIVVLLGLLPAGGPHASGGVAWELAHPVATTFADSAAAQPHPDPVEVLLEAARARDAGRADSLEAAWLAALRRNGDDRMIRLGLAGLARLTARPARADSLLTSLGARDLVSPDLITLWAAVEMAEGLRLRGQFAEARPLFEAAGAWARELSLPALEARTALGLAGVLTRLEGNAAAEPHRQRLFHLRDAADPWLRAVLACQDAQRLEGTASQIRDQVEAVTSASEEAGFPHLAANCLSALYLRFRSEGQVDSTLAVLGRMETLARRSGDRTTLAAVLQWRSDVYPSVGAYGSATRYAQEAVEEGRAGGNLSAAAWAHLTLASVGRATGDLDGALDQLAEARGLFHEQGDRWGELHAWRRQAHVDALAGRHTEARRTLEEILPELVSGYGRGEGAFILLDLLDMALAAGDALRADSLLPVVRQELEATGNGGWVPGLAWRETHIALALNDLPRARASTEKTLAGTRVATSRYLALSDLALVRLREGDAEGATEALEEGLKALSDWRASVPVERLKTSAFALTRGFDPTPPDPTASVVAALVEMGAVGRALALAEGQRARSLLESVLKAEAFATGEVPEPTDLLARVPFPRPMQEPPGPGDPDSPPQIPAPPGEEQLRRALPPGTAALLTVTGGPEEPSTAFLLTRDTLLAVPLPPAGELASLVERLATGLRSGLWLMAPGDELSWVVARPIMEALPPESTTLVWVPDGPLHALPLDALAHPRGGRVLDHLAVARAPSLSVLVALLERSPVGNGRVVALADPGRRRGGPGAMRSSLDVDDLPPLPGSRQEAALVSRLGSPGLLLRGPAATEASVRRLSAPGAGSVGVGVLHLATHAVVDPDSPSRTALVLAPGGGEDGLLTPAELAALRLKADLVVLSACATAGGLNLRGEGIQGLVAPLLGGGVRAAVATSWEIPDRMPAPLMESFYRELAGGAPVAEAMRRAKKEAIEMGASPAVWAAFQVVGDPGVTPVLRTRAARVPGVKMMAALLGLLALAAVLRGTLNDGR